MPYVKQHLAEFIQEKESLLQLKSNKENSRSSPYLNVSDQSRSKGNRYCASPCKIDHVSKQCMYIKHTFLILFTRNENMLDKRTLLKWWDNLIASEIQISYKPGCTKRSDYFPVLLKSNLWSSQMHCYMYWYHISNRRISDKESENLVYFKPDYCFSSVSSISEK